MDDEDERRVMLLVHPDGSSSCESLLDAMRRGFRLTILAAYEHRDYLSKNGVELEYTGDVASPWRMKQP